MALIVVRTTPKLASPPVQRKVYVVPRPKSAELPIVVKLAKLVSAGHAALRLWFVVLHAASLAKPA